MFQLLEGTNDFSGNSRGSNGVIFGVGGIESNWVILYSSIVIWYGVVMVLMMY